MLSCDVSVGESSLPSPPSLCLFLTFFRRLSGSHTDTRGQVETPKTELSSHETPRGQDCFCTRIFWCIVNLMDFCMSILLIARLQKWKSSPLKVIFRYSFQSVRQSGTDQYWQYSQEYGHIVKLKTGFQTIQLLVELLSKVFLVSGTRQGGWCGVQPNADGTANHHRGRDWREELRERERERHR